MVAKTIWIFGPSGSGKTTIGSDLVNRLQKNGRNAVLIDGDELRNTICKDLSFSYQDRMQQAFRAAHMANAVNSGNSWAVVSLITPFEEFRLMASRIISDVSFVYLKSDINDRIKRDPKGLYKKAIDGSLEAKLTGYDGDFDEPKKEDAIVVNTSQNNVNDCIEQILENENFCSFVSGAGI